MCLKVQDGEEQPVELYLIQIGRGEGLGVCLVGEEDASLVC